jgi:hypothetical protein
LERELALRPEWVKKTPQSPFFYNGIGIVSKANPNYKEVARKLALENISNEISVNIAGESVMNSIETNTSFQQEFRQQIKLTSEKYLEGYELVDSYENDEYYYVYYQLSKSKYQELKRKRLEQAKEKSILFYKGGVEAFRKGAYRESMNSLIKSLEPLVEYLDQKIEFNENDTTKNLPLVILQKYKDIENKLRLKAVNGSVDVVYGEYVPNGAVGVNVYNENNAPVTGIPLRFEYKTLYTQTKTVVSNNEGLAAFHIGKMNSKIVEQYVRVTPDFDMVLQEQTQDRIVRGLLKSNAVNEVLIQINVRLPKVFISFSQDDLPGVLVSSFKNALLMNEFEVTNRKSEADLFCEMKIQENYTLLILTHEVGGSLSFYDKNYKLIYSVEIPVEKGVHVAKQTARQMAFEEVSAQIKNRLIPLFSTRYFED